MTILREVVSELVGMFLADARLTLAILALVSVVAGLIRGMGIAPTVGGLFLMFGCLIILVESAVREARVRRRS
jgi:hypothetical protein